MKPLPHNHVAEEQIIACLLYDPKLIESIGGLTSGDFYAPSLSKMAKATIDALRGGLSLSDISTAFALDGYTDKYLELTSKFPRTDEFDKYVKQVKQTSQLRRAIDTLYKSAEQIKNNEDTPYEQLSEEIIGNVIGALDIGGTKKTCVHVADAMQTAYDRVLALHSGESDERALQTGILDLDRMLSGLWPGDSIVVAGRPSMGKSAFGLTVALHVATEYKRPVVLFSLEMSNELEANRVLSFATEINSNHIRNGRIAESSLHHLEAAVKKYRDIPLYLDDKPSVSIGHVRSVTARIKRECGDLALVVVDYMQLMGSSERNREREIAIISQSLKALAKDLSIPVISLSQLNRMLEQRNDKRPQLSDLRESGAIEQDADVVIFLYRDDYYNRDSKDAGTIELIVGKNRSGQTGTAKALFDRELTRFRNYVDDRADYGDKHWQD